MYAHPYVAEKQLVAVDCVIFGFDTADQALKLLLFQRKVEPLKGEWSLIGSFVKKDEDVNSAAKRVLFELTGIDDIFLEQLKCYGDVERDIGDRVISMAYWSIVKLDQKVEVPFDQYHAKWFKLNEVPDLVLDHNQMVTDGLEKLRKEIQLSPIVFELLPELFTMPQLIKVYEELYQTSLDDRNFRKRFLSSGIIVKTNKKDKSSSKKGAFLYKFDPSGFSNSLKWVY